MTAKFEEMRQSLGRLKSKHQVSGPLGLLLRDIIDALEAQSQTGKSAIRPEFFTVQESPEVAMLAADAGLKIAAIKRLAKA